MLASVVPRSNAASAMANMGLPSAPATSAAAAGMSAGTAAAAYSQQLAQQLPQMQGSEDITCCALSPIVHAGSSLNTSNT